MGSFTPKASSDRSALEAASESVPILGYEQKSIDVNHVTFKSACDELKKILRLSWPVIFGELIQMLPLIYNLRMAGMLVRKLFNRD
ncbi:hypothetical protein DSO57_1011288 [Entomophthora muscae]|uniref:Uncharacterized protein n=1 Tax=Entomophthora muscae TaxID=34485 RepID=A0ACC2TU30_9FUNG|nr:hypothetical protein DSO57_1011288 [Entomophthora muscae]